MTAIDADIPCIVCAYNLRGLRRDGVCPECGSEIERSFRGDLLRYANEHWLQRVSVGLRTSRASMVLLLLTLIVALFLVMLTSATEMVGWYTTAHTMRVLLLATLSTTLIWPLGMACGLWLASTPEPRAEAHGWIRAMVFRWACALVMPAIVFLVFFSGRIGWSGIADATVRLLLGLLCLAIIAVHAVMMLDQLRALDFRCSPPHEALNGSDTRDAKLRQMRTRILAAVVIFPVFCLPAYWGEPSEAVTLAVVYIILWLIAMSAIDATSERVRGELSASRRRA